MRLLQFGLLPFAVLILMVISLPAHADIARFVGDYVGTAEVTEPDGTAVPRDMSVKIVEQKDGFQVNWTSTTYRSDGRVSEKTYSINFVPTARDGIFAAAMQRNVFGHQVQLDPMKGEPFVWARIEGDTLSVFSLYVTPDGGYEMQQFDRTLTSGGLDLKFSRVRNGEVQRTVNSYLVRQ